MANEFTCWNCKGDGTRCDCAWKKEMRSPVQMMETTQQQIDRNEREIAANIRRMEMMILRPDLF